LGRLDSVRDGGAVVRLVHDSVDDSRLAGVLLGEDRPEGGELSVGGA
jgi:hypothetical protein